MSRSLSLDGGVVAANRPRWILLVLTAVLCLSILLALRFGAVRLDGDVLLSILGQIFGRNDGASIHSGDYIILLDLRLPRVLLSACIGAGLGICGAVIQGLFRNPLAEPSLIGISAGAALFAALFMVFFSSHIRYQFWLLPLAAFAGGLLMTWLVYLLGQRLGDMASAGLLLAGIAVNALVAAVIALVSYLADAEQLQQLLFWTLGSMEAADWTNTVITAAVTVGAIVGLLRLAVPLNCLLLGEEEAGFLGMNVRSIRRQAILLVALVVGVGVAFAGIIGFVGLVVPHLIRLIVGPDHRLLLPASALLGALLLVLADLLARVVIAPAELPIGILTALLGGPFFIWLLLRQQGTGHA